MTQVVGLTKQGNVGVVAVNNPPVNALSHAVRLGLREHLGSALADPTIAAIVIRCEGRTFIAGADIRELGKPPLEPDLPEIVEFVGAAQKPVIAALHGTALGGGLELALACHFRIALASAKLGLPEVGLGILPGAGGTQRLPRLVGARAALDMIVGGGQVAAAKARSLGLVDEVCEADLEAGALAFAARVLAEGKPLRNLTEQRATLDDPALFEEYERRAARESRGLLAPFHAIRAVRAAVELPFAQGLARERELFQELIVSPQSKAQRHVFFGEREVTRVPGLPDSAAAREVKNVAVVADGAEGARIAACFAGARLPVALVASTKEQLDRVSQALHELDAGALSAGALRQGDVEQRLALVRPSLGFDAVASADLVVEAVFDDSARKREVWAALDAACKPGAVLASQTPSLDLEELAGTTKRAGDVVGLHFFAPAERARALEVAAGSATAPEVLATALKVGKALGKVPVVVRARGGLASSRTLERLWNEALRLVDDGAQPEQVDRVLYDFGFPAGPFAGSSAVGLGIDWLRRRARAESRSARRGALEDQEILERCLFAVVNEGARLLEAGSAARPLEIDMLWVHGLGFPVHRGGPMFYADQVGLPAVCDAVRRYRESTGDEAWTPAALLERLAAERRGFYG